MDTRFEKWLKREGLASGDLTKSFVGATVGFVVAVSIHEVLIPFLTLIGMCIPIRDKL